jgi:hypothetical protein
MTILDTKHNPWDVQVGGGHYKQMQIQPAQFIMQNKLNWCQGNVVKYICRYNLKGTAREDLLKVKHYVDLLLEYEGLNVGNDAGSST